MKVCVIVFLTVLVAYSCAQELKRQRCRFVNFRTRLQWRADAYRSGETLCPVRCCGTFGTNGITLGCLSSTRFDFTAYRCCNDEIERVMINGKYVCPSTNATTPPKAGPTPTPDPTTPPTPDPTTPPTTGPTSPPTTGPKCVRTLRQTRPPNYPGANCTSEFIGAYPKGFTEEDFVDRTRLCTKSCYWKTGEVKPPYHYYHQYKDCCPGWKKCLNSDGKYTCRRRRRG